MKRFWELDKDKSGTISLDEFQEGEFFKKLPVEKRENIFKRLDTNSDGVISPQDRPEPPFKHGPRHPDNRGGAEGPARINVKLDTNGDGALSFDEFRLGPAVKNLTEDQQEDRFELLDRNGDKKISPDDFPATPPEKPAPAEGE
jgi:Ca2+-binding EF-hand superfamily protein